MNSTTSFRPSPRLVRRASPNRRRFERRGDDVPTRYADRFVRHEQHELAALYGDILTSGAPLFIALQTEAELLFGAQQAQWGAKRLSALQTTLARYRLLSPDRGTAAAWADLMTVSRALGRQLSAQDAWIAATAQQFGLTLVSHDRDYPEALGLSVLRRS